MGKRKYRFLTNSFFMGSIKSQINSVYRDKESKPEKVLEFKWALKNGDCGLGFEKLNKHQFGKIIELGFYDREIKSL